MRLGTSKKKSRGGTPLQAASQGVAGSNFQWVGLERADGGRLYLVAKSFVCLSGDGEEDDGEKKEERLLLQKLVIYEIGENRRRMAKL